jgi:hypothetical protein
VISAILPRPQYSFQSCHSSGAAEKAARRLRAVGIRAKWIVSRPAETFKRAALNLTFASRRRARQSGRFGKAPVRSSFVSERLSHLTEQNAPIHEPTAAKRA